MRVYAISALAAFSCLVVSARADSPVAPAPAAPAAPSAPTVPIVPGEIAWHAKVADAVAAAKAEAKPLFVAINATRVDGGKAEPAGRELRDNTYRDASVVEKSRAFACVIVYADAAGEDFDQLRSRFSIGSQIVSPQHIFAYSDGGMYERREYWSFGKGQASVDALLEMMNRALAAERAHVGAPPLAAAPPAQAPVDPGMAGDSGAAPDATPTVDDARRAWIDQAVERIRGTADALARASAIREFLAQDRKNDCIDALCTLAIASKKETDLQIAIVRGLGRPGYDAAVPTMLGFLDAKSDDLRSNTIVSLEYVGSALPIDALSKRLSREKDERIYANVCRALGRCGAKDEAVRKTLVRELQTAKSDCQFAGATIGLAHFEKSAEAARALEHEIKKNGAGAKRAFALWALTEIMDPKSAEFVKKEVLANEKNPWVLPFVSAVYNMLVGQRDATRRSRRSMAGSATRSAPSPAASPTRRAGAARTRATAPSARSRGEAGVAAGRAAPAAPRRAAWAADAIAPRRHVRIGGRRSGPIR